MKILKKIKIRAKPKLSSLYLFETIGSSNRYFVFGLNWFVVLGENLDKEAYKLARKQGADYYLRGGGRANTVGLLKTNKNGGYPDRGKELHSIAATFARTFANSIFVVRFKTPLGYWIMVAHDGLVQEGTDCFYDTIEETDGIIQGFKKMWGEIPVYGDQPNDIDMPDLGDILPQTGQYTRLKRASVSLRSIPIWGWAIIALGAGYFAYDEGTTRWEAYQAQKRRDEQRWLQENPTQAWRQAILSWAKNTPVLGGTGIDQWGAAIASVPTHIGRWELAGFNCSSLGKCTGEYFRMPLGSLTSFEQFMPEGWEKHPKSLNVMAVNFSFPLELTNLLDLGVDDLPKIQESKKVELNLLQGILPIVNKVDFSQAEKAKIKAPQQEQSNGSMRAVPFPSKDKGLVYPYVSTFEVSMPLRGLLALRWKDNYAITSIEVAQSKGNSDKTKGLLQLKVKGEYYVQE